MESSVYITKDFSQAQVVLRNMGYKLFGTVKQPEHLGLKLPECGVVFHKKVSHTHMYAILHILGIASYETGQVAYMVTYLTVAPTRPHPRHFVSCKRTIGHNSPQTEITYQ